MTSGENESDGNSSVPFKKVLHGIFLQFFKSFDFAWSRPLKFTTLVRLAFFSIFFLELPLPMIISTAAIVDKTRPNCPHDSHSSLPLSVCKQVYKERTRKRDKRKHKPKDTPSYKSTRDQPASDLSKSNRTRAAKDT